MACLAGPLALRPCGGVITPLRARSLASSPRFVGLYACPPAPPPRHVYGAERRLLLTYLLVAANMKTDEVDK